MPAGQRLDGRLRESPRCGGPEGQHHPAVRLGAVVGAREDLPAGQRMTPASAVLLVGGVLVGGCCLVGRCWCPAGALVRC